jgi:hypothetical protein
VPLYKKLEKKYEKSVIMPELERKKERLKSIRELHQPLDFGSIRNQARAYSQKRSESIKRHLEEKERKIMDDLQNYQFSKHRSMFLNNILDYEKEQKEIDLMKSTEK